MIFDPDDLGRKKGLHFGLLHLHPIDAKLHHPIARQFDGMVHDIHHHPRQHQLLQQLDAIGRSLHLLFGGIDNFAVRLRGLVGGCHGYRIQRDGSLLQDECTQILSLGETGQQQLFRRIPDTRDQQPVITRPKPTKVK